MFWWCVKTKKKQVFSYQRHVRKKARELFRPILHRCLLCRLQEDESPVRLCLESALIGQRVSYQLRKRQKQKIFFGRSDLYFFVQEFFLQIKFWKVLLAWIYQNSAAFLFLAQTRKEVNEFFLVFVFCFLFFFCLWWRLLSITSILSIVSKKPRTWKLLYKWKK